MGNKIKYLLYAVIGNLITLTTMGAVFQTFLMEYGLSEQQVNVYNSVLQIFQICILLLFAKIADRSKNVIRTSALTRILEVPLVIFLVLLCYITDIKISIVIFGIFALGLLYNFSLVIQSIICSKLPYIIIDVKEYGKIGSINGTVSGITLVVASFALSAFQTGNDYFFSMKVVFIITAVLMVLSIATTAAMKPTYALDIPREQIKKHNIFKYAPFTKLIIPNLARGLSSGVAGMAVTIGYFTGVINSTSATYIVIIGSAASIVGCFLYSVIIRRIDDGILQLVLGILTAVLMPLMFFGGTIVFLVMFAAVSIVKCFVDVSLPVTMTKIVDYDIAGEYSSWKMVTHNAGTALAGFICIPLFNLVGVIPTMIGAGLLQLICGVGYFFYLLKNPAGKIVQAVTESPEK